MSSRTETVIVIAILYLAKPVVVPIALAILFAFLLTPIVGLLERILGRTGAVVLSLGLAVGALGFGGWWIYQQLTDVAREFSETSTLHRVEQRAADPGRSGEDVACAGHHPGRSGQGAAGTWLSDPAPGAATARRGVSVARATTRLARGR